MVEVGQRYRIVRAGGVRSAVWEVTRVFMPWRGGFEHVCIKDVDGPGETMPLVVRSARRSRGGSVL